MKKGISFSYEENGNNIIRRYQVDDSIIKNAYHPNCVVRYSKDTKLFEHPFLSWDNFSYAYSEPDEEELDDYLLNHALQDNKKTSLALITKRKEEVLNTFSNDYNVYVNERKNGFFQIFVARKGCLADYFDEDDLEEYYDSLNIPYRAGIFYFLMHSEMIDLLSGNIKWEDYPTYNPMMLMNGNDGIATSYGSSAGLISGLLFGYPIESSISMVNDNGAFFHGNLM